MPLEIRELVIRAAVEPEGSRRRGDGSAAAEQPPVQQIVEECVEQVLEALRLREER